MENTGLLIILIGEIAIIVTALKDKNYSQLKAILVFFYLIVGINFPFWFYAILELKINNQIPIIRVLLGYYAIALFLIGIVTICYLIFRFTKTVVLPKLKGTRKENHLTS